MTDMSRAHLNRIKQLRTCCNPPLKQVDLAVRFGTTQQVVSRWESGEDVPSLERAIEIAQFFGTTVERVFYGLCEHDVPVAQRGQGVVA